MTALNVDMSLLSLSMKGAVRYFELRLALLSYVVKNKLYERTSNRQNLKELTDGLIIYMYAKYIYYYFPIFPLTYLSSFLVFAMSFL